MNLWPNKKIQWIILLLAVTVISISVGWISRSVYYEIEWEDVLGENIDSTHTIEFQKKIAYQENSPNGKNISIKYNMQFDPALYKSYYGDYFSNQSIIAVRDNQTSRENYIFTGEERAGNPHWLGNNYIFFTTYCGTACQGLYLINIANKETTLAVLSYLFSSERNRWETHFKDWFNQEFKFDGSVDEIKVEMLHEKVYLVFTLQDGNNSSLGQKRFLFTNNSLNAL